MNAGRLQYGHLPSEGLFDRNHGARPHRHNEAGVSSVVDLECSPGQTTPPALRRTVLRASTFL